MKILLVEDTRAVAAIMAARLSAFGHDVRVADDGQAAIQMFQAQAPDLVLMDIEMPVMNGFEAASRIRALKAQQPWAGTPIMSAKRRNPSGVKPRRRARDARSAC